MGNLLVTGRVAAAVAVVSSLAIGLHGRVAKALEKVTVSVSDDGLAWIRRTRRSLAACALNQVPAWGTRPRLLVAGLLDLSLRHGAGQQGEGLARAVLVEEMGGRRSAGDLLQIWAAGG